jgi:hypothetical protein
MRLVPLAFALLLAAPAAAQAPSPQATAAATELVDVLMPAGQARSAVDAQVRSIREGQMVRAMIGANPQGKAELAKNAPATNAAIGRMGAIQADALGPIFTEMQAASRQAAIANYARSFSVEELRAITAFYRTPAGSKLARSQGQVMAEAGRQVQQQFGPRIEAAQKRIGPQLEAEFKKGFPQLAPGAAR